MNFLALSGKETGCGKEFLQITKEKVARKAGYQYPIQNRKVMTTQPRSDDSGDKVVPRGVIVVFTTKKNTWTRNYLTGCLQIQRFGLILLVRAFEF